jgi:hypothetical protein
VDVCDVAEQCDGQNAACPADGFKESTFVCREAEEDCDVDEQCTGSGPACPPDLFAPATIRCRSRNGVCDVAENCSGTGPECPPDDFAPTSAVCRPSINEGCDPAEHCTGDDRDCPDNTRRPDGEPCNDANACTREDFCQNGVCEGENPVVCQAIDQCHEAGTCNPATGRCSTPPASGDCNDGSMCTVADTCRDGVCTGVPVPGCCRDHGDCDDGIACTDDRCVAEDCVHVPLDDYCGPPGECGVPVCDPMHPARGTTGCVSHPANEATYCSEDGTPCTIDVCRTGTCAHEDDRSGARCTRLERPFTNVLELLAGVSALHDAVLFALAANCPPEERFQCDAVTGPVPSQVMALLDSAQSDLQAAAMVLSGRLAGPPSPDVPRDPIVRARLARTILASTLGDVRAFLANLKLVGITPSAVKARRIEGRRVKRGIRKLRLQLRNVGATTNSLTKSL